MHSFGGGGVVRGFDMLCEGALGGFVIAAAVVAGAVVVAAGVGGVMPVSHRGVNGV